MISLEIIIFHFFINMIIRHFLQKEISLFIYFLKKKSEDIHRNVF